MITYEEYEKIRTSKGMRDSDIAKKCGFYQSVLSDWKKGISRPKADKMLKIAEALDMDYREFIGATGLYSSYNLDRPPFPGEKVDHVVSESGNIVGSDPDIWAVVELMQKDTRMHDRIFSYAKFLTSETDNKGEDS